MNTEPVSRVVMWCIFVTEIACLIPIGWDLQRSIRGAYMVEDIGLLLLLIATMALAGCAVAFVAARSLGERAVFLAFLGIPIFVWGSIQTANQIERQSRGQPTYSPQYDTNIFTTPETKALGSAIDSSDLEKVKQILPTVKNLNQPLADNRTILSFAAARVYSPIPARLEIVRLLLKAGADPNPAGISLIELAIRMTEDDLLRILLEAGSNPNALDAKGRPVWWGEFEKGYWEETRPRMLLDHGADVKLRAGQQGPLSVAAAARRWDLAVLLIERGADWKQEKLDTDQLVSEKVLEEYKKAESSGNEISKSLLKLKQMYEDAK